MGGSRRGGKPGREEASPPAASEPAEAGPSPSETGRRRPATAAAGEGAPASPLPVSASAPGSRLGYARVSTDDQNLDLQRDALACAGCRQVYEEKQSGKTAADRPELAHVLADLRPGDTLVVWRLDRLGRNLPDLVRIVSELQGKGVAFESLTERIDTGTAAGELIFHLFASLAQFERNLIRERTRAGLASARARGRKGGRPLKLGPKEMREIRALLRDPDVTISGVATRYGVSRTTLYAYLKVGERDGVKQKG